MTYHSLEDLQKALPAFHMNIVMNDIGADNVDWILDNHHLYSANEIAAHCKISRQKLVQFFHICGISTEYIYSANYTTPRIQGELAGRARVDGYKVEGHTITRGSHPNEYLERQAIGIGFQVFDEYGNELVYPEINRPKVLATEYSNAIDITSLEDKAAKRVDAVRVAVIRETSSEKPKRVKASAKPKPKKAAKPKPKKVAKPKADKPKEKKTKTFRVLKMSKNEYKEIVSLPEKEAKKHRRKGYFYTETYNKGHGHMATRFVAEIMVRRHRYRFRSTNSINVTRWLDDMLLQYQDY